MQDNIILIGMPGSGKSTLGVQLAKSLGLNFIDTDLVIQNQQGQLLQTILNEKGYQALRDIEEEALLGLELSHALVSTGGSAVYSDTAMKHLSQHGTIIYLDVTFEEINKRINNEGSRGIARPAGQTLEDVYHERTPLYKKYADITIDNNAFLDTEKLSEELLAYKK
ncbi:MAG: shikimate kinase [Cellvibrionaceae bacterium]